MENIELGKRIGLFMKHCKFVFLFIAFLGVAYCMLNCSPIDMPCGLILNYDLPKGADSIHVVVYKNDSVRHVFRDSLFCSSCGNEVVVQKGTEDFRKKDDWEYGEYQVEEIVYCNGKQTVFSAIPLTLKKGFISIIDVAYSDYLGSKDKRYLPSQNECGIDSTYVIFIEHSDYCAE